MQVGFTDIERIYQIFRRSTGLTTDSRAVQAGNLFWALKGEKFDGNQFAGKALEKGAVCAVVDEVRLKDAPNCFWVRDTLEALQALANYHRRQFTIPILAITGSNGKTTTKELVHAVLNTQYHCQATKGNLNNHIGVPLTLLNLSDKVEIAVVEMGANHQGEIAELCKITEPTHGLITNIGKAHLEGFGGIEGVKKGKGELYNFLAGNNGIAFVNLDEQFLGDLSSGVKSKVTYQQGEEKSQVKLNALTPLVEVSFDGEDGEKVPIKSQLFGIHNFQNIMTAIVVGRHFKVPGEQIKFAIENYIPENNRSQILSRGSNRIILDAYNANPSSMKMALHHFVKFSSAKKIAILGSMLELGAYSPAAHLNIAKLALDLGVDQVILVGNEFKETAQTLGLPYYTTAFELKDWWVAQQFENTTILIKGSRGIGLETILSFPAE